MSGFGQPPGGAQGGFGAPPGAPGGQPGSGGFGPPGGQQMGGAPPGGGAPAGEAPNFILWMIIGFAQIIFCGNLLFGIPAGVLALLAKNEWDQGQFDSSKGKLKISKIIGILGIVLVFLGILAYVILYFVLAGANAAATPYGNY